MKRIILISIFLVLVYKGYSAIFEFSFTNKDYFVSTYRSFIENVYVSDFRLSSKYVEDFVRENLGITNFELWMKIYQTNVLINVYSEKTNFSIYRFPVPFIEGMEILYLIDMNLKDFSSFSVADYGNVKIFKLDYKSGNAYLLFYFDKGEILRVDYWIKSNQDVMLWSYLCAYDSMKSSDKKYLSGILLNVQAKEFYKFDFRLR